MARGIDAEHVDVVVNLNLPVEKALVGLGLGWETKRPCFCRFLHRISSIICWFKCTPLLEGPTLWAWIIGRSRVVEFLDWELEDLGSVAPETTYPEKSIRAVSYTCGKCRHWCWAKKSVQNAQYYKILNLKSIPEISTNPKPWIDTGYPETNSHQSPWKIGRLQTPPKMKYIIWTNQPSRLSVVRFLRNSFRAFLPPPAPWDRSEVRHLSASRRLICIVAVEPRASARWVGWCPWSSREREAGPAVGFFGGQPCGVGEKIQKNLPGKKNNIFVIKKC